MKGSEPGIGGSVFGVLVFKIVSVVTSGQQKLFAGALLYFWSNWMAHRTEHEDRLATESRVEIN
jgi:hypothetical protein